MYRFEWPGLPVLTLTYDEWYALDTYLNEQQKEIERLKAQLEKWEQMKVIEPDLSWDAWTDMVGEG